MKKTLLLSASGPGVKGVGGVLIRDMLRAVESERVTLAALLTPSAAGEIDPAPLGGFHSFEPPAEFNPNRPASVRATLGSLADRMLSYDARIRSLTDEVAAYMRNENPERLWVILNSTAVIDTTYTLLRRHNIELLVQVWDDPEHLCRQRNLDRVTRERTWRRFEAIVRRAGKTAVICEDMAEAYAPLCPGGCVVVRHGVDPETDKAHAGNDTNGEFKIGISGSMYSPASWKTLQQALDRLDWQIDGRQVVLVVVGGKVEFTSRARAECRFLGWRPPEEAVGIMAGCDLLYLPQAFEGSSQRLTRLSFPTKMSAYAATGRPIFVHTPENSSLTRFCREHDVGILCNSLDNAVVAGLLRQLEDPKLRAAQAAATQRIASSVLTRDNFERAVRSFLGHEAPGGTFVRGAG